jgi:hypothetical protein
MMNFKKIATFASLAVLTTGIFASLKQESAQALTLTPGSRLNISSNASFTGIGINSPENGEPLTTIDFLNFPITDTANQPAFPGTGEFSIIGGTGSFAGFNPPPFVIGTIKDLPTALLGNGDPDPNAFVPVEDFLTFSRGGETVTFDLETLGAPEYAQSGGGTSITIGATGNFDTSMETDVPGDILFAGEFVGFTANEVRNIFRSLGTIEGQSSSADLIVNDVQVPESSSVLSLVTLGLVGTGFAVSKRKKNKIS